MTGLSLNRRCALRLIAALVGGARMSGMVPVLASVRPIWSLLHDTLSGFFTRPSSAGVIASEYLRIYPDENDEILLARFILRGWTGGNSDRDQSAKELQTWIRSRIRADFEMENVIRIRGWILSRTEVRVCAFAAIISEASV